ncbi:MAG: hypothetical protein ACK5CE_01170 [Actinomycetes bacterium]|jgi:hypothetical protein|uniref:Unannotated protein n=1 Tax=freshwater metagenome TaxID=449393 RepID=A0A6J6BMI5_9ZZZZ|nr:hypothetical protein [Actinomycetota bacterium]
MNPITTMARAVADFFVNEEDERERIRQERIDQEARWRSNVNALENEKAGVESRLRITRDNAAALADALRRARVGEEHATLTIQLAEAQRDIARLEERVTAIDAQLDITRKAKP